MPQSWDNVLSYIKLNLGAPLNMLEFTDDELIENLKEHALPYFSQYSPLIKYMAVSEANRITPNKSGQPLYVYKLPREDGEVINSILDVYWGPYGVLTNDPALYPFDYQGAIDVAIANAYVDVLQSMNTRRVWDFRPPETLILDTGVKDYTMSTGQFVIVQYTTDHKTLDTIDGEFYTRVFKKLCLAHTKSWLAAMRSKYEGLSTPFGQLNLNWQLLQEDSRQLFEEVTQFLQTIPPDRIIDISI